MPDANPYRAPDANEQRGKQRRHRFLGAPDFLDWVVIGLVVAAALCYWFFP